MTPYADTNFYTRLYLQLPESDTADRLLNEAKQGAAAPLPVTWLHRMEILNAFQLHVFQAHATGQRYISAQQAAQAHTIFRNDVGESEFLRPTVIVMEELEKQFEELSLRRTARHGFRTYDVLHVASALSLECDTFWSFDAKVSRLAKLEGLMVIQH
jgi:predicted nucleic acid-binding protein